jgi:hypothetical protein
MQKKRLTEGLKRAIVTLEHRQTEDENLLKEQVSHAYESLKPINVLHKTLNELITPSELKDSLVQSVLGILSGYLSRKILVRSSTNAFLRLAGIFVQFSVTNLVSHNSEAIKKVAIHFIDKLTGNYQEEKK